MEAFVNNIFFTIGGEPSDLGTDKRDPVILDNYQFKLSRKLQAELEMSRDDSDGYNHSLVIGFFVDDMEVKYVTDWFPNDQDKRAGLYAFDIPKYAKYSDPKKTHKVQVKLGERKWMQNATIGGVQIDLRKREYNLFESEIYYYKVAPAND